MMDHMAKDNLFKDFYEANCGLHAVKQNISDMIAAIAHRYPRMNILEVGAGTGGTTSHILPRLESAFASYTYTEVSANFLDPAEELFKEYEGRMKFKTFDMTKSASAQGFTEESYDLVIASNVLHATHDVEATLKNIRSLVKPGGYVAVLEAVHSNCLRVGLPMGTLPGFWFGVDDGRPFGPTLSISQWDKLLQNTGFSGIDTVTPAIDDAIPGVVFCSQAVDDSIKILRNPVQNIGQLPTIEAPQLTFIAPAKPKLEKLCNSLSTKLEPFYSKITRVYSVQEVTAEAVPEKSTVIMLAELDTSPWKDLTPEVFEGLKNVYRQSGTLLWISKGVYDSNPHANMSLGVGRAMKFEYPHLNLQALNIEAIDSEATPTLISEYLIRLETLGAWAQEERETPRNMLWSLEPEVSIEDGRAIIPRLYPYGPGNQRYNTSRRNVKAEVSVATTALSFVDKNGEWGLEQPSPLQVASSLPFEAETIQVEITDFLLSSITVAAGAKLLPCVGIDVASGERVLALSHGIESTVSVPKAWTIPIGKLDSTSVLAHTSARLIAKRTAQVINAGDCLILHDPHPLVADLIDKELASRPSVKIHVTSSQKENKDWQFVGERFTRSRVNQAMPFHANKFLDFSQPSKDSSNAAAALVANALPASCQVIDSAQIFGTKTEIRPWASLGDIETCLRVIREEVLGNDRGLPVITNVSDIPLQQISNYAIKGHFGIVNCSSKDAMVTATVRAIDEGNIFRDDKTYFLVGLSGEIGQSLCKWMVTHGARYLVLTSRNPKVSQIFMDDVAHMGATVKVLSMDVTNRESLRACHQTICDTMPPVVGVANGAMILRDMVFDNMPFDIMDKVLKPKVLGSELLDELFYDTPLDFFIFFSSMTAVLGNSGQSNYIAGNMFMNALATQRKKRGVAGSSINISSVIGLGVVERSEDLDENYFTRMGYRPMSEQDLQISFAEAMLLGRPECNEVVELSTGIKSTLSAANIGKFLQDIKFSNMMQLEDAEDDTAGASSNAPLKTQLGAATSKQEASSLLTGEKRL